MYRDWDIVADIKKESYEWIGHLEGMELGKVVKKIEYLRVKWMEREEWENQD
jgi:hypothetical protein